MNNEYDNLNINISDNINDYNIYAVLSAIQSKYPNCSLNVEKYGGSYSINIDWTLTYTPTSENKLEEFSDKLFKDYLIRYSDSPNSPFNHYVNNGNGSYSFAVNDTFYVDSNETIEHALSRIESRDELTIYTSIKGIDGVGDGTSHINKNNFNSYSDNYNEGETPSFYLNKTLERKRNMFYEEFRNQYPLLNPTININENGTITISVDNNNFSVNSLEELHEKMSAINFENLNLDSITTSNNLKRKILEKYPYADISIEVSNNKILITYNGKNIEVEASSNLDSIIKKLEQELFDFSDTLSDYSMKYTYNNRIPSYRFYSCINFDDETTYKDIYNFLNDSVSSQISSFAGSIQECADSLSHPSFASSRSSLENCADSLTNIGDDSRLLGNLIDSMVAIYKTCDKELKDIVDLFLTNDLFKDAKGFAKVNYKGDFEKYIKNWSNQLQNDYNKVDNIAAQINYGYRFNENDYNMIRNENKNYNWNNNDWHIVELSNGEKYYYLSAEVFNNLYNLNDENVVLNEGHLAYKYINSINLYAATSSVASTLGEFKTRLRRTIELAPYFKDAIEDGYKEIYNTIVKNYNGNNMSDLYSQIIGDKIRNVRGSEIFFTENGIYMTPSELAMAFYQLKKDYRNYYLDDTIYYDMDSQQLINYTNALRESLNERQGISEAIDYVNGIIENGAVDFNELVGMFGSGYMDGLLSIPQGLAYLVKPSISNSSKYYRDKYIFDYLRETYDLSNKLDGTYTPQEESMYRLLSTNGLSNAGIEGLEFANNFGNVLGEVTTNVAMDLMHIPAPVRLGLRAIGEGGKFAKEVYNEGRDENMARVYGFSDALISFAVASIADHLQNQATTSISPPTDPFTKAVIDTRNSVARTIELMFFSNPSKYAISRVVDEVISQIESNSFNIYQDYGFDKALQDLRSLRDNFNDATDGETFGENFGAGSIFVFKTLFDIMDFD